MSDERDGGYAFPTDFEDYQSGMLLVDYFAAKVLAALVVGTDKVPDGLVMARRAYDLAEAMVQERQKRGILNED